MRKVERQMIDAIRERKDFKSGNTEVRHSKSGKYFKVFLHGHMIANGMDCGLVTYLTDAGYQTRTTKSRLNAMIDNLPMGIGSIYQRDWKWYYTHGGQEVKWNGSHVASMLPDASSMDLDMA